MNTKQFDTIMQMFAQLSEQIAEVDARLSGRMDRLEASMDERFDQFRVYVDERFDQFKVYVDERFDQTLQAFNDVVVDLDDRTEYCRGKVNEHDVRLKRLSV